MPVDNAEHHTLLFISKNFLTLFMNKSMLKTVNVSEKGQIAIPKDVQELLDIKKGDRLVLTIKNKKILIQKATAIEKYMEDNFDDLLKYSELSLGKLWNDKKDEIWEKYLS